PHELAIEAEARGFESVWFPEHSHIPTSRKSPWPGGAELPKWYYDTYDPFVAMGAAAVVTKTIKLGTGVCLVVQRDPIHTAKEVATVDRLSNGWMPIGGRGGDTLGMLPPFHEMLKKADRKPEDVPVTLFGVAPDAETLKRARDAGVGRVVFGVPPEAKDKVLGVLDKGAGVMRAAA